MHNQLEKYLSQIEKQLAALPAEQRQEELREIRSHLEMMIEENIARGYEVNEATAKAIEQFGVAIQVGHNLKNSPATERKRKLTLFMRIFAFATIYFLAGMTLVSLKTSGFLSSDFSLSFFTDCSIIVLTFIYGWNIESLGFAPKKVFRNTILMFFAFCGVVILFPFVFHGSRGNLMAILIPVSMFVGMCISRLLRLLIGDNSNAKSA